MISIDEVEHVALLARLALDPEEKKMFAGQLSKILEYSRSLDALDTENVPPTAHVLPLKNVFREDVYGEHLPAQEALANAPLREGSFFKVPRIV